MPTLSTQENHWIPQAAQFVVGSLPNAQQPAVERVLHQLSVICTILNTNVEVQVLSFFYQRIMRTFEGVRSKLRHLVASSCGASFWQIGMLFFGDPQVCFVHPSGDIFLRYGPELFYSICPIHLPFIRTRNFHLEEMQLRVEES
jgi:hypothetical protein